MTPCSVFLLRSRMLGRDSGSIAGARAGCRRGIEASWRPFVADPQMMKIYSHPRLKAERLAVEALATAKAGQFEMGCVTNHATKALPAATVEAEVIEKIGRGARI